MSSGMIGAIAVGGGTGVIDSAGIGGMAGTVLIRGSPFSLPDNCRASRQVLYHERLPRREEPTVSANRRKRPRSLGFILEQDRDRESKAGEEVAAIQLLADADHLDLLGCGIDVDLGLFGIDDPDTSHSGLEIVVNLPVDCEGRVASAENFNGQIRNHVPDGNIRDATVIGPAGMGHERDVGSALEVLTNIDTKEHFTEEPSQPIGPCKRSQDLIEE